MPTIDISDRIERFVTNYSADQGKTVPIHLAQKVLEGGRLTTQLLSYPADGSEPTGYIVKDSWFDLSGLPLAQLEGTMVEREDGTFAFSALPYAQQVAPSFAEVPAELGAEVAPGVFAEEGSLEEQIFGEEDAAVLESEPSKKRRR